MNRKVLTLIAVLALIILIVVFVVVALKKDDNPDLVVEGSIYSRVIEKVTKYNDENENDIELVEAEDSLIYTLKGMSKEPQEKNDMVLLNYTEKQIIIMEYDQKYTPIKIITFEIDTEYNITKVIEFDCNTEEVKTHELEAIEIAEFKTIAQDAISVSKKVFAGEDVNMFNKTIVELKKTK